MNSFLQISRNSLCVFGLLGLAACAHTSASRVDTTDAVKLDKKLVRESVIFEADAKNGAVVPEISAPRLRAVWIPERTENDRLVEAHREWILDGDVTILGIPHSQPKSIGVKKK